MHGQAGKEGQTLTGERLGFGCQTNCGRHGGRHVDLLVAIGGMLHAGQRRCQSLVVYNKLQVAQPCMRQDQTYDGKDDDKNQASEVFGHHDPPSTVQYVYVSIYSRRLLQYTGSSRIS